MFDMKAGAEVCYIILLYDENKKIEPWLQFTLWLFVNAQRRYHGVAKRFDANVNIIVYDSWSSNYAWCHHVPSMGIVERIIVLITGVYRIGNFRLWIMTLVMGPVSVALYATGLVLGIYIFMN